MKTSMLILLLCVCMPVIDLCAQDDPVKPTIGYTEIKNDPRNKKTAINTADLLMNSNREILLSVLDTLNTIWDIEDLDIDNLILEFHIDAVNGRFFKIEMTDSLLLFKMKLRPVTKSDSILFVTGDNTKLDSIMVPNRLMANGIDSLLGKHLFIEKYTDQTDVSTFDPPGVIDDSIYVTGTDSILEIGLNKSTMAGTAPKEMMVKVKAVNDLPETVKTYFPVQDSIYAYGTDSSVTNVAIPSESIADVAPREMIVKLKPGVNSELPEGMAEYYREQPYDGTGHFAEIDSTVERIYLEDKLYKGSKTRKDSLLVKLAQDNNYSGPEEEYLRKKSIPPIDDTLYVPLAADRLDTLLIPARYAEAGSDSIDQNILKVVRGDGLILTLNDIMDPNALVNSLLDNSQPASSYIRSRIPMNILSQLRTYNDYNYFEGDIKAILTNQFNNIVMGENIYDEERFSGIKLSSETSRISKLEDPSSIDVRKLNRMLLSDVYPDIRKPPQTYTKRGIPAWLVATLVYTTGYLLLNGRM